MECFWIAALPFQYNGANAELTALADGLTEDVVTGLSRFSDLRVIARSSTLRYAHAAADVRAVGKELGACYVMEGSLRAAGSMLRLTLQLVDTSSGAHLRAENYNRSFREDELVALQERLGACRPGVARLRRWLGDVVDVSQGRIHPRVQSAA